MSNYRMPYSGYEDIINLPHHVSETRPHMSSRDRAAQFSPFAALTGYDDEIKETARLTDEKLELDEDMQARLNRKMQILIDRLAEQPMVEFTFFIPDENKAGGAYRDIACEVKKIDEYQRTVTLTDGTEILIDNIYDIRGDIFRSLEDIADF